MGKGESVNKGKKRGSRSSKLQMLIPYAAIKKRVLKFKPRDKRLGDATVASIAAIIEALCRPLFEDACKRVGEGHMLNVKHLAQSLNDRSSPVYGLFTNRVACVYTTPDVDANATDAALEAAEENE